MTFDEKDWLRRFRRNEPGTFDALYSEYGQRIFRFCCRLSSDISEAEDLTQEVFVAAYQGLGKFQARASLATWLYRIALFRWHARRRNRQLTTPLEEERASARTAADPAGHIITRIVLDDALKTLPENLREAFLLVKGEGLSCQEAAAVLNIPNGTLKYHVHQAILRLRQAIEEEPDEEPEIEERVIASPRMRFGGMK